MTTFSISAVWYPLWAFVFLVLLMLVPSFLPVHDFHRYISGLSCPRWLSRIGFVSFTGRSQNSSHNAPIYAPDQPFIRGDGERISINKSDISLNAVLDGSNLYEDDDDHKTPDIVSKLEGTDSKMGRDNKNSDTKRSENKSKDEKGEDRKSKGKKPKDKRVKFPWNPNPRSKSPTAPTRHANSNTSQPDTRIVGAASPTASEDSKLHQVVGRQLNYTPMFASLQSPLAGEPNSPRKISGNTKSVREFEITTEVEQPQNDQSNLPHSPGDKKGKKKMPDLEAQRPNSALA